MAGIVALGRLALRPLFRGVARTRSPELFVAACLLVVIATGLATAAAGLSMALGALIGGLLLAGTEYRRQVEVTIDPFKGLFVGVFLISVGMSLDLRTLVAHPLLVLGSAVGVVLLKLLIIAPLTRVFGVSWRERACAPDCCSAPAASSPSSSSRWRSPSICWRRKPRAWCCSSPP